MLKRLIDFLERYAEHSLEDYQEYKTLMAEADLILNADLTLLASTLKWWREDIEDEEIEDFEKLSPYAQQKIKRLAFYAQQFLEMVKA